LPTWILLLVLIIAPLVLIAARCVTVIARFFATPQVNAPRASSPGRPAGAEVHSSALEREPAMQSGSEQSRACEVCGQRVLALARTCRHCGALLVP
jgi:hypothetical protein